jgi:uncharacterized protein (TIGR03437 family)
MLVGSSPGQAALRWANEFGNAFRRSDFRNIRFELNDAAARNIPGDARAGVQAALDSWNALPNTALRFAPIEMSSAGIVADGHNVIAFAATAEARNLVGSNAAFTVMYSSPDGSVRESDIILNPDIRFSTTLLPGTVDFQGLITHELGHALGANHAVLASAAMFWSTVFQDASKARLQADDAAFAAEAYPLPGADQSYGAITGRVTRGGVPLLGAGVIAIDRTAGITIGGLSSVSDGSFSLLVPAGNYILISVPVAPLTPPQAILDLPATRPGEARAKIDSVFAATLAGGTELTTIRAVAGGTTSVDIAAAAGPAELSIDAEGIVSPGNTYFIGLPPISASSGQALDYIVSGTGLDGSISEQDIYLFGPGVRLRPGTLRVEGRVRDLEGRTPLRFTIEIDARSSNSTVSLFVRKGSHTAFLPGAIAILPAKPVFTAASVLNAASFKSAGVAPGELVSLFGSLLAPDPAAVISGFDPSTGALPTQLGGASVTFDGIPAPLIFTSSGQINLQVPYEVAGKGSTAVMVVNQGVRSEPITVNVAAVQPSLFTANGSGSGQVSAVNVTDGSINGPGSPAAKGSYVTLYATGAGAVDPQVGTGRPAPASPLSCAQQVTVTIAGRDAPVYLCGVLAPGFVGLLQVSAQIPADTPSGNVPVTLSISGRSSPSGVHLAVR